MIFRRNQKTKGREIDPTDIYDINLLKQLDRSTMKYLIKAKDGSQFWTDEYEKDPNGLTFTTTSKAGREFKHFLAATEVSQIIEMEKADKDEE